MYKTHKNIAVFEGFKKGSIVFMTEYLFIILAVVFFSAQFALTKLYEGTVGQTATGTLIMLFGTSLVGQIVFFCAAGFQIAFSPISMVWAIILAVIMIPYYMIGIKVLSLGSLAVYSMFMMLGGMLVPFFYGIIFLREDASIGKILGTVLLTAFIVMQALWQNSSDEKKTSRNTKIIFFLLCILIFFINGMTGVVAKAHSISEGAVDESSFTATSCAIIMVLSLFGLFYSYIKRAKTTVIVIRKSLKSKPIVIMLFLGIAAYGGNFLMLLAADKVPASIQFPLVSGGVIVLSALVSAFIFREKLSKKEWISVAGAFMSTVLFAF
jgi:drug/metabolite transporter (DMT)-like permease